MHSSPPDEELPSLGVLKARIARQKEEKQGHANVTLHSSKYAGVDFVVNVAVGGGLGYFLDMELATAPWLMFIGLMLGMASGFLHLIRQAEKLSQEESDLPQEKKDDIPPQ